jgi:hypothetical protein
MRRARIAVSNAFGAAIDAIEPAAIDAVDP